MHGQHMGAIPVSFHGQFRSLAGGRSKHGVASSLPDDGAAGQGGNASADAGCGPTRTCCDPGADQRAFPDGSGPFWTVPGGSGRVEARQGAVWLEHPRTCCDRTPQGTPRRRGLSLVLQVRRSPLASYLLRPLRARGKRFTPVPAATMFVTPLFGRHGCRSNARAPRHPPYQLRLRDVVPAATHPRTGCDCPPYQLRPTPVPVATKSYRLRPKPVPAATFPRTSCDLNG